MNCVFVAQPFRVVSVAAFALTCLMTGSTAVAQLETRGATKLSNTPYGAVSGDFNRDGKLDLAVAGGVLSVLRGRGDGTFQKPVIIASSTLSLYIAAADFNGDGNLDLVIDGPNNAISVYLGNGDGTFQSPLVSPTSDSPTLLVAGDFNNDHKVDLAIIDPPYISVLLGNGDGTFQAPIDNNSFLGARSMAVGDFNNDHRLDVVVSGSEGGTNSWGLLLGNGDGTLQPAIINYLDYTPGTIAAGDLNHDGNVDVVLGSGFGPSDVAVYLGNGDGTFQSPGSYGPVGGGLVVADLNGDGNLDIVTTGVYLIYGNGDGTFGSPQLFPAGKSPWWMLTGDFNGDHKPDVVLSDTILGEVMLLNTGVVNFSPSTPVSFPTQLVNTTSRAKTVKLTNTGNTALSITSVNASGPFHTSNTCGDSVAAGGGCEIKVAFSPLKTGPQQGLVTIADSASSKPQVIEVSGIGTDINLSPNPMKFGSQKVGTKSAPQQMAITNDSNNEVIFSAIGARTKDFVISGTGNCTNQALAPGGTCYVTVTFTPTKTGTRSATLNVGDDAAGSPQTAALMGTGAN